MQEKERNKFPFQASAANQGDLEEPSDSSIQFHPIRENSASVLSSIMCKKTCEKCNDLGSSIDNMVEMLHQCIDQDFRFRSGNTEEELFVLPYEYQTWTIEQKVEFCYDLVQKVCNNLREENTQIMNRASVQPEFVQEGDILSKLQEAAANSKGIKLSEPQCRELTGLLLGALRKQGNTKYELADLENKYLAQTAQLFKEKRLITKRQEEQENLVETNTELRTQSKQLQQQCQVLDVNLQEQKNQLAQLDLQNQQLREEIMAAGEIAWKIATPEQRQKLKELRLQSKKQEQLSITNKDNSLDFSTSEVQSIHNNISFNQD